MSPTFYPIVCIALALAAVPAVAQTLASAEGPDGMVLEVTSFAHDGKHVTLKGRLVNNGSKTFSPIGKLNSPSIPAKDPRFNASSISGIYVIDKKGNKKASPLFTQSGACICTEKLGFMKAGSSVPIFASFPAPSSGATELDVVLPSFLPVQGLPISGADGGGGAAASAPSPKPAAPQPGKRV